MVRTKTKKDIREIYPDRDIKTFDEARKAAIKRAFSGEQPEAVNGTMVTEKTEEKPQSEAMKKLATMQQRIKDGTFGKNRRK